VAVFVRAGSEPRHDGGRRAVPPLRRRRLVAFLPASVTASAILGTWVTAQITFVLAGGRRVAGQRFVGAFHQQEARLSVLLGRYVLVFAACTVAWAFLVGRLSTRPVLFAAVAGVALASGALVGLNHGGPPLLLGRWWWPGCSWRPGSPWRR
jgi:hypothetical protein